MRRRSLGFVVTLDGVDRTGVQALGVGVAIDDLNVSKVAGSSLTSGGFNDAVEQIKAEARA